METSRESVSLTEQLRRFSNGEREIAEAVLREVLPELHRVAARELGRDFRRPELSPTELIHEAWLRNLGKGGWEINNREHFYAIAALAMRGVIIDLARFHLAQKRGKGQAPLSLSDGLELPAAMGADIAAIVEIGLLMERLEKQEPQIATVVNMHYFTGFTLDETADILRLTYRQARHRWERGRDWLKLRLRPV